MDSVQLHKELQKSGDRLLKALSLAQEANHSGRANLTCEKWLDRLELARRKVERAAEYYAHALSTYRSAALLEFAPSLCRGLMPPARPSQLRSAAAPHRSLFRDSHSHSNRDPRWGTARGGISRSTRSSKTE
jgi:hypothetical protein